jgi:hypothetical protein
MSIQQCPACGETENLRGSRHEGAIRLRCDECGHAWVRATQPQCATCGGNDIMQRPQTMTAFSRGTQLSVLGWRNVNLCLSCDRDAIARSTAVRGPLSPEYRAAAEHRRTTDPTQSSKDDQ